MPDSRPPEQDADPEIPPEFSSTPIEIERWLENLHHADRSLYNMMALEVWAIAKTMDGRVPGFWSRFMENRQSALKQFMEQKQTERSGSQALDHPEEL